ncbi:drug/metabolite transporter (DMT)-like permease [Chryseobacterium bernardetii]|uniref:Threonine/homoserine efflux transporter RhtA n=2 Tax=Chryseobacterium TaxID=59732 RepID=A0A543EGG2_9FLAO|nr:MULTISPECIES: DMT family transporter [Chryseobacterium]MDR6370706.1 drug/metabolite transporter (DMT)-like permease [Chryseobacterium vietnamense]MDR6441712.1 drug/metabolite transporter (DMT)-like permease [Chryseobacterium bernardetii]MDR6485915.1 drug/metabolite transporter (DMT)-like permease [Chryseobacterium vietnamense]TQM20663.1 threonine/homoserine efflux transporter RhtA [Chryseobacterium aquifrigidense]
MKKKNILKGVLFVGIGASIYGMLATFVKMAYHDGFTTSEVTTSQFVLGLTGLLILNFIQTLTSKQKLSMPSSKEVRMLLLAGTSLGGTSLFYYIAVQYINVSIAIVLLMQSVWFSVVIESILTKKLPNARKVVSVVIVLLGTVLATNLINMEIELDWHGVFWGLMAAASYTLTMFTSNTLATHLPVFRKSFIMLAGGSVVVFAFLFFAQIGPMYFDSLKSLYLNFTDNTEHIHSFNYSIFPTYGLVLALFGTIIPPVLFNVGFPNAGLGLGSIVSSLELPVSVTMAFVLLGEKVFFIQWVGIVLILFAIVLMNLPSKKGKNVSIA